MQTRYIDGSVQDCSNSIANALELLQVFHWAIAIGWCTRSLCAIHNKRKYIFMFLQNNAHKKLINNNWESHLNLKLNTNNNHD